MFLSAIRSLPARMNRKAYEAHITEKYDYVTAVVNREAGPELTLDDFDSYGLTSLKKLLAYMEKEGEYGGSVYLPWEGRVTVLPFHHDFMNDWLKFKNPRVTELYDRMYQEKRALYRDREDFDRRRFDIEEELQVKYWKMPVIDRRVLDAPVFGCWDNMELVAHYLKLKGYPVKRLCFHDGIIMRGHTFVIYNTGEYWTTCLSYPANHHYRSYENFCNLVFQVMKRVPIYKNKKGCTLIEFGEPYPGMTTPEYLKLIESGTILLPPEKRREKSDSEME